MFRILVYTALLPLRAPNYMLVSQDIRMDICLYFPTPYPTPTPSVCLENIPLTVEAGKLDCGHAVGLGLAGQMHMGR